jgi:hypothetical protein
MNMAANRTNGVGAAADRVLGDVGAQTVFPSSVHDSGGEITWAEGQVPSYVDGDVLLESARLLARLCLTVRYWPSMGAAPGAHRVD